MAEEADLEAAFRRIGATRMLGIPILNPALSVEAVAFRDWNGRRVGVLIAPWSINLVLLGGAGDLRALPPNERRCWQFPSGTYEFMGGNEPECGPFDFCSLFSPPGEFTDQAGARAVAEAVMAQLFDAAAGDAAQCPAGANAGRPGLSRRSLLFLSSSDAVAGERST
jgi:[NiFe] hydrogenase assembly HybE family chaperone